MHGFLGGLVFCPIMATSRKAGALIISGPSPPYVKGLLVPKAVKIEWFRDGNLGTGATGTVVCGECSLDAAGTMRASVAVKGYDRLDPMLREMYVMVALQAARRVLPPRLAAHGSCIVWGEQVVMGKGGCKLVTLAADKQNLWALLPRLATTYHIGRDTRHIATMFSDLLWAESIMAFAGVCHNDLKCSNIVRVSTGARGEGVRLAVVDFASSFLYTTERDATPTTLLRARPCATRSVDSPAFPMTRRKSPAYVSAFAIAACCLSILQGDENALNGFPFFVGAVDEAEFGGEHASLKAMMLAKLGGVVDDGDREAYLDGVMAALLLSCPLLLYKVASAELDAAAEGEAEDSPWRMGMYHFAHSVKGVPIARVRQDTFEILRVLAELINPAEQLAAGEAGTMADIPDPIARALASPLFTL